MHGMAASFIAQGHFPSRHRLKAVEDFRRIRFFSTLKGKKIPIFYILQSNSAILLMLNFSGFTLNGNIYTKSVALVEQTNIYVVWGLFFTTCNMQSIRNRQ